MRWHTFESLARVLCAGVLGYFGYQMLLGHNPFGSGPPSPLMAPLFLGIALYQLFQAWKGRKGIAAGEIGEAFEQHGGSTPVAAPAPVPGQRSATRQQEMQEEMTRLRIAAASDPKAAMMLRARLRKQLAESTAVHDDERHEAIRRELADLEKEIKLLQYKG